MVICCSSYRKLIQIMSPSSFQFFLSFSACKSKCPGAFRSPLLSCWEAGVCITKGNRNPTLLWLPEHPHPQSPQTENGYTLKWFLESHFLSQCLRLPHLRALPYGSVFLGSYDADSHLTKVTPLRMLEAGVCSEIWFKRSWMTVP